MDNHEESSRSPGKRRRAAPLLLPVLATWICLDARPARGDPPPEVLRFRAADYPLASLLRGEEAQVPCELSLDESGAVVAVACEGPVGDLFVDRAGEALAQARFSPGASGEGVRRAAFVYRFAQSAALLAPPPPLRVFGEVFGEVLVAGERVPVPGAEVVAQGLGVSAVTDGRGRYRLRLPPGSHVLVASAPELDPVQARVELEAGKAEGQTLHLRRREVGTLSATVQAEKAKLAPTRTTLVREELRNVPGAQGDPLRVIEDLPGLARVPYAGGQLLVRGSNAQDTGAYIDGQRIPVLYHLLNGPSVLGEETVERIDFYPGGAGVYFGRNLAGVVAVTSRRGDADRVHGSAAVDLQKFAGFLQGPAGERTQFSLGARRSFVNPLFEFFSDARKQITLPLYWDYQARLDHRLDGRDRLLLTLYGSDDSFALVGGGRGSVPLTLGRTVGFHRARLVFERVISESLSVTLAPFAGIDRADESASGAGGGAFAAPRFREERAISSGLRADAVYRPAPSAELRGGLDVLFDRVRYDLDQPFDQQLRGVGAPNAEERRLQGVKVFASLGEYAEAELRRGPLRLVPGLRLEQLHIAGRTHLLADPRLWARIALDGATSLHAYAGVYHQAPLAEQVDAQIGNPGLSPLRAEQFGVGAERRFSDAFSIKVEGYLARRHGLVFPVQPVALAGGGFDNPLQRNSGEGRSLGLEVLVRRELTSRFYGWVAYTFSRSRELRGDGGPWLPSAFDQPHVLTLLFGLRVSPYVEFAVRARAATGNPATEAIDAIFDADSGSFVPRKRAFGATRLPTFFQLDFEVNNIWASDDFRLQLYLDFQNAADRLNPELLLYDFRYQQAALAHGVPFSAIVGAKVSF